MKTDTIRSGVEYAYRHRVSSWARLQDQANSDVLHVRCLHPNVLKSGAHSLGYTSVKLMDSFNPCSTSNRIAAHEMREHIHAHPNTQLMEDHRLRSDLDKSFHIVEILGKYSNRYDRATKKIITSYREIPNRPLAAASRSIIAPFSVVVEYLTA